MVTEDRGVEDGSCGRSRCARNDRDTAQSAKRSPSRGQPRHNPRSTRSLDCTSHDNSIQGDTWRHYTKHSGPSRTCRVLDLQAARRASTAQARKVLAVSGSQMVTATAKCGPGDSNGRSSVVSLAISHQVDTCTSSELNERRLANRGPGLTIVQPRKMDDLTISNIDAVVLVWPTVDLDVISGLELGEGRSNADTLSRRATTYFHWVSPSARP